MSKNWGTRTTPDSRPVRAAARRMTGGRSTTRLSRVKDQASDLANSSAQAGEHVGDVAGSRLRCQRPRPGAREGTCLSRLKASCMSSRGGQQRDARSCPALSGELRSMARTRTRAWRPTWPSRQRQGSVMRGTGWRSAKPGQVVGEVQSFARGRQAVFLVLAARAGLVDGRLTRGLKGATGPRSHGNGRAGVRAGAWAGGGPGR